MYRTAKLIPAVLLAVFAGCDGGDRAITDPPRDGPALLLEATAGTLLLEVTWAGEDILASSAANRNAISFELNGAPLGVSATTASARNIYLSTVPPGSHTLGILLGGQLVTTRSVDVSGGEEVRIQFDLDTYLGLLTGGLFEGIAPAGNRYVLCIPEGCVSDFPDADSNFRLLGLATAAGEAVISTSQGAEVQRVPYALLAGDVTNLGRIELELPHELRLEFEWDGRPLYQHPAMTWQQLDVRIDDTVIPNEMTISPEQRVFVGYLPAAPSAAVGARMGDYAILDDHTIALEPGSFTSRVLDLTTRLAAVRGALRVGGTPPPGSQYRVCVTTGCTDFFGSDGGFLMFAEPGANVATVYFGTGAVAAQFAFNAPAGLTTDVGTWELELPLEARTRLLWRGRPLDETGAGNLPLVDVLLNGEHAAQRLMGTISSGTTYLTYAPPGDHTLDVTIDGNLLRSVPLNLHGEGLNTDVELEDVLSVVTGEVVIDGMPASPPVEVCGAYGCTSAFNPQTGGFILLVPPGVGQLSIRGVSGLIIETVDYDVPAGRITELTDNHAPIAVASGPAEPVPVGVRFSLSAVGSNDPDGSSLSYAWAVVQKPAGSTATLVDAQTPDPSFTPDLPGSYRFSLFVSDGALNSQPAYVDVTVLGQCAQDLTREIAILINDARAAAGLPPLALDPRLLAGTLAHSTAMASADAGLTFDGLTDRLSDAGYGSATSIVTSSGTTTTAATIADRLLTDATAGPLLMRPEARHFGMAYADGRGRYWTMSVGSDQTDGAATGCILTPLPAVDYPPVADIQSLSGGLVGEAAAFDGGASVDPEGAPLSWQWTLMSAPTGSAAGLTDMETAQATLVPDLQGVYEVQLVVTANGVASAPVSVQFRAGTLPDLPQCIAPETAEAYNVINRARISAGVGPLQVDLRLVAVAEGGSVSSAATGQLASSDLGDRTSAAGYPGTIWEVMAVTSTATAAADLLVQDDVTRGVMLAPEARHIGIATASGTYDVTTATVGHATEAADVACPPLNAPPVAVIAAPATGDEGSSITFDGSGSTDDSGVVGYEWDLDNDGTFETSGATATRLFANDGSFTVALRASDADGATHVATHDIVIRNVAPVVTVVTPAEPIGLQSSFASAPVLVSIVDPGADLHITDVQCGNGTAGTGGDPATAVPYACSYTAAGVYVVTVRVDDGGVSGEVIVNSDYVVVYDPAGGFVTGGGWIDSPAGALVADPAAVGRATFGFVSRYQSGNRPPDGDTEFRFRAGGLVFRSTSYDWLVISGPQAQYRGVGQIDGLVGEYAFMVTARDGEVAGDGEDGIRIRIWRADDGALVYDNRAGADAMGPDVTRLGGGNVVIHRPRGGSR